MAVEQLTGVLEEYKNLSQSEREKGGLFERMIANYLVTDPQFADLFEHVWLWSEWPHRWGSDDGIDLVAQERATGEYAAIQCKFYDPAASIAKGDIDSFLSATGKRFATPEGDRHFSRRYIFSTTDKWTSTADKALENQQIPVHKIGMDQLAESPVDWDRFTLQNPERIPLKARNQLREHQREAIDEVISGFVSHDRGKLIMACGTGKTFTSLRLMEETVDPGGFVLFLAPSISLVSQSLREWTAQANDRFHAFAVCSDSKVGREAGDLRVSDLAFPATTDASRLAAGLQVFNDGAHRVIFATYQSIQVVADALAQGVGTVDLVLCDEAHRTAGVTLEGEDPSEFVKVHDDRVVPAHKRLYMTATPRIFTAASQEKAKEKEAAMYSMDDVDTYGPEFHRLGFGRAVELGLLSDYRVMIVAVKKEEMDRLDIRTCRSGIGGSVEHSQHRRRDTPFSCARKCGLQGRGSRAHEATTAPTSGSENRRTPLKLSLSRQPMSDTANSMWHRLCRSATCKDYDHISSLAYNPSTPVI